ncbi:hypothetical protein T4E_10259 [Trichinella pseudospiralis]|uniref:Uncharacterized protein n=1 Tax=Trichinella pseudospiralis TaxID=6337 RepID=A0A0V0Y925_TRIPS|nr:hypothetical protein T4E_10259 [Trichinella pseudospiralis]
MTSHSRPADSSPLNTHTATSRWVYCHSSSTGFDSKTAVRIRSPCIHKDVFWFRFRTWRLRIHCTCRHSNVAALGFSSQQAFACLLKTSILVVGWN